MKQRDIFAQIPHEIEHFKNFNVQKSEETLDKARNVHRVHI